MNGFYYTYVLESESDGSWYIGFTSNLRDRLERHNKGYVKSTSGKLPWKLIYFEGCLNRKLAIKREKQLKTGFGRAYLKRRLLGVQ
jgi:putative endonuclease